jgi:hypothetical protein
VELQPGHTEALYNLSRAVARNDPAESKRLRDRLMHSQQERQTTERAETLANSAISAANMRDWQKAASQLREAIAICGDCPAKWTLHKNLGLILCQSGDLVTGERELRLASTRLPGDAEIQNALATLGKLKSAAVNKP